MKDPRYEPNLGWFNRLVLSVGAGGGLAFFILWFTGHIQAVK